jgi:hypothetical protein
MMMAISIVCKCTLHLDDSVDFVSYMTPASRKTIAACQLIAISLLA